MDRRKNKYYVENVVETLFLPLCGLIILYCLTKPLIYTFEYIRIIQFVLFAATLLLVLSGIISMITKDKDKKQNKINNSWIILKWIFIIYFVIYLLLQLDTISVYFNYLMVLLLGIVIGYRLATRFFHRKNIQ